MGKKLIINGADFSQNGILLRSYIMSNDTEMESADVEIVLSAMGCGYANQTEMRGKELLGVRLNVATAGSMRIFKATGTSITDIVSSSQMTYLTTISTQETGIQDIEFDEPIILSDNEFLIFGDGDSASLDSLTWYYNESSPTNGGYQIGTVNAGIPEPSILFRLAVALFY
jgi:hypothetical protein